MEYVLGGIILFIIFRKLTAPKVEHINMTRVHEMLKEKKVKRQFIDVRTPGEFNGNKVKGFKNIPLQGLKGKLDLISKDEPVVLICASGARSMNAARVLNKAGYNQLINVKGGIR